MTMRYLMKGGYWKNSEDEVLKAAVMKYGLNQWSRISSLLARKSAKQCKARWYEWLDPAIKKTEWTREEEEKLLHLAKIFPSQWRTISPIVGRTPAQCVEHYERLLDQAQGRDQMDENDPRRLKPGEIDPTPEIRPARADAKDMDDDEKEMIAEARVRMANIRGKKAKRRAREKFIEKTRQLAQLQKQRELRAAGIEYVIEKKKKKKKVEIDYNAEIPFEHRPLNMEYKPGDEEEPAPNPNIGNISLNTIEGVRRDEEERKLRKLDEKKLKKLRSMNLPSHIEKLNKVNPLLYQKKTRLVLPEPQLNDKDLELLGKMTKTVAEIMPSTSSEVTRELIGNYSVREPTPVKTPRYSSQLMKEARQAYNLVNAPTPMMGGNAYLLGSELLDSSKASGTTPNPYKKIVTEGIASSRGETPLSVTSKVKAADRSSLQGLYQDELSLNNDDWADSAWEEGSQMGLNENGVNRFEKIREVIRRSLSQLPEPRNDYEIDLPELEAFVKKEEEMLGLRGRKLDLEDVEEIRAEAKRQERLRDFYRQSQVKQRFLPLPTGLPDDYERSLQNKPSSSFEPEYLIKRELSQLIANDIVESTQVGVDIGDLPNYYNRVFHKEFEVEELEKAEYLLEEERQKLLTEKEITQEMLEQFVQDYSKDQITKEEKKKLLPAVQGLLTNLKKQVELAELEIQEHFDQRAEAVVSAEIEALNQKVENLRIECEIFDHLRQQESQAVIHRLHEEEVFLCKLQAREANFKKLLTVVDQLRDAGLNEHISLPRVAVLGTQSAGKSSLLEAIVGLNFLPRGDGVVTRRPLELRIRRLVDPTAKPYAVFDKEENSPIYDFAKIKDKIEELTEKVCGNSKGIVDIPIVLNVYSPSCPDLTLIDLPGITRIAQGGQAVNVEEVTKNMAARYCGDERTIILCVVPANQDMSTSDALQMAMKLDPKGERTIGVVTKIDIMDRGTNARRMIMNEEIPLKLGFVGVKGRSQLDIKDGMRVGEALKEERNYFAKHPVYANLPPGHLGTEALTHKLTTVMYKHIKKVMPSIISEIDHKIYECDKNLKDLGTPLPHEDREKLLLVWRLISEFADKVKTSISGEYKPNAPEIKPELLGGVRIRLKFNDLFLDQMSLKHKASKKYSDADIKTQLRLHMGNTLPGFTSADAFQALMNPLLEKLKKPALNALEEIHGIMEQICVHYINETFTRFPMFIPEVTDSTLNILNNDKEKARLLMSEIIDANIGYTYTKDPEYIAIILPQSEKDKVEKIKDKEKKAAEEKAREEERQRREEDAGKKPNSQTIDKSKPSVKEPKDDINDGDDDDINNIKQTKEKAQKNMEKVLIREMRTRIDTYFRVVATQLADLIPKLIGHNLVNAALTTLQFSVFKRVSAGGVQDLLKEPEHIIRKRETLRKVLEILRNSRKILLRDPDLAYSIDVKDSSHIHEMRDKDRERKKQAAQEKKKSMMEKMSAGISDLGSKMKTGASDLKQKIMGDDTKATSTASTSRAETRNETPKYTSTHKPDPVVSKPAQSTQQAKSSSKTEDELAMDAAKLAWKHKDTIAKVAKDNPELVEKAAKAATNPENATKTKKLTNLFGY